MASVTFQPSLFEEPLGFDERFSRLERRNLGNGSWIDVAPGWLSGGDALFEDLERQRPWKQRTRRMYEGYVQEPRLTSLWLETSGEPLTPPLLERVRACLSARYRVHFDSIGFNLYRDGRDSVAMHRDRIDPAIAEPIVALVSLGEPRRFLLKPKEGGPSLTFDLGNGALLVTGGRTQRDWEHGVPKVARAGPRISLAFRHGMVLAGYEQDDPASP